MVEQHVAAISRHLDLAEPFEFRDRVLTNDQAHGAIIFGLLNNGRGAKLDQASADQLTEEYLDAIEELPAWTVREALRKWNKGASVQLDRKKPHDFTWRPAPATLGRLSYHELWIIKARVQECKTLLAAVARIEFSDEHRAEMREKFADLLRGMRDKVAVSPPNPDQGKQPEWSKEGPQYTFDGVPVFQHPPFEHKTVEGAEIDHPTGAYQEAGE